VKFCEGKRQNTLKMRGKTTNPSWWAGKCEGKRQVKRFCERKRQLLEWLRVAKNWGSTLAFGAPVFVRWWRRRESNPRPQALYRQFYILSTII